MLSQLNLNFDDNVDYKDIAKQLGQTKSWQSDITDEDNQEMRMRKMAAEVLMSFVDDILTIKRIRKYSLDSIQQSSKSLYQKKYVAELKLIRHVNAVNWFVSGEAINSIWFQILGIDHIGQGMVVRMIKRKIESER